MRDAVVVIAIIMMLVFQPIIITSEAVGSPISDDIVIHSYTEHSPFVIESDNDLDGLSLPGNGTISNPYVFTGYNFTSSEPSLLIISNTSRHIDVIDNIFHGSSVNQTAISLYNVSNIHISNNSISDMAIGISANFTGNDNISIDNNSISYLSSVEIAAGIILSGWFNISSMSGNKLDHIYSDNMAFGMKFNSTQTSLIDLIGSNTINNVDGLISHAISIYAYWEGIAKVNTIEYNEIGMIESSQFSAGIYFEHIHGDNYHGSFVDISKMQYNTIISIHSEGDSAGIFHGFNVRVKSVLDNSFSYIKGSGYFYGNLDFESATQYLSLIKLQGNYFINNTQGLALSYINNFDITQNLDLSDNLFAGNIYGITVHTKSNEIGSGSVIEGLMHLHDNTLFGSQSYAFHIRDSSTEYFGEVYFSDFLLFHNNFIDNNPNGQSQIYESSRHGLDVRFNYYSDHPVVDTDNDYIIDFPYALDSTYDRKDPYPTALLNPNNIKFNPSPIIKTPTNNFILDLAYQSGLTIEWEKELGYNLNPFSFNVMVNYPETSNWIELESKITSNSFLWDLGDAKLGYNKIKIIAIEDGTGSIVESEELLVHIIDSSIIEIDSQTLTQIQIYGILGLSAILIAVVTLYIRNKRLKTDLAVQKDPKLKQAKLKEYAEKGKDLINRDE